MCSHLTRLDDLHIVENARLEYSNENTNIFYATLLIKYFVCFKEWRPTPLLFTILSLEAQSSLFVVIFFDT